MDQFIDIVPQDTFHSNCKYQALSVNGDYCVLSWNLCGTVILRRQAQFTSIDVDFCDKNFHRNLSFNDDFRCSMAALNYSGLFLASKRVVQDQDDYEEDAEIDANPNEIDKKASYIYFKPLNEWKKQKEWNYKMNDGESVEAIASGSGWCACYTD